MNIKKNNFHLKCAVLAAIVSLTACSSLSNWGFGDKSNLKPPAPLHTFKADFQLAPLWSVAAVTPTAKNQPNLSLAATANTLYTADNRGKVVALNADNGHYVWQSQLGRNLTSGPIVTDGRLAVTSRAGHLFMLQANNGQMLWQAAVPGEILAAPDIGPHNTVVKTISGTIRVFDNTNGQLIWQYHHGEPQFILNGSSDVVLADHRAVVGYADGTLIALDIKAQQVLWELPISMPQGLNETAQMVGIIANPVIKGDTVYTASYQGNLAAIQLATGKPLWSKPFSTYQDFLVEGNTIYIADADSHLYAIDRTTGKVRWQQDALDSRYLTAPVYMPAEQAIVVADAEGYVHVLSAKDGHFMARAPFSKYAIVAAPVIMGKHIYVLDQRGVVTAGTVA